MNSKWAMVIMSPRSVDEEAARLKIFKLARTASGILQTDVMRFVADMNELAKGKMT